MGVYRGTGSEIEKNTVKIEIEIYEAEESDRPAQRLGFCIVQTKRGNPCGAAIMADQIDWVELENKAGYVCGNCYDSMIRAICKVPLEASKPIPKKFAPRVPGSRKL